MIFSIIILFSCSLRLTNSDSVCTLPNTGTVLFRNIDVHRKHCWSREELALLYTRRAMMELIPRQIPHNIPLILEFLQICLTTLREVATSAKVYDYMVAALADTFGGYLQTYGLPLLHEAYYEGYVSYDNAAEFHRLQDNFKSILMTNGEGWTKPMEVRKHINRILPLKMPSTVSSKPCTLLLTEAAVQKCGVEELSANENQSLIPLPIIDDSKNPNSIAIPFKNHALFNLKSRNSYDVLIKYYIEATRCISKAKQTGLEQSEFDHVFLNWLKSKVTPHLRDESWFVGFSNVLRIEETIQQREGMISAGPGKQKDEESLFSELESETQLTTTTYIIIFVILLVSLILICFLYWTFIKNCILCCGNVDLESTRDYQEDSSDRTSLLTSASEDSSRGRGRRKPCKHDKHQPDTSNPPSARSGTEGSKLTLSCGLGKGFSRSHNRK